MASAAPIRGVQPGTTTAAPSLLVIIRKVRKTALLTLQNAAGQRRGVAHDHPDSTQAFAEKAQETFAKAHNSAAEQYGEGERAHRVAYSALKRKWQSKGDRWVEKGQAGAFGPPGRQPAGTPEPGQDTSVLSDSKYVSVITKSHTPHFFALQRRCDRSLCCRSDSVLASPQRGQLRRGRRLFDSHQ
jgi:cation transport regulator ChaB